MTTRFQRVNERPNFEQRAWMASNHGVVKRCMLTSRELEYYEYVRARGGVTIVDIANEFQGKAQGVANALSSMFAKGYIARRQPGGKEHVYTVNEDD